jgi:outer membrane PBP1 activator LpoA protein
MKTQLLKRSIVTKLVWTIAIAALSLVGCTSSESETPVQAIQSIIQLYEARDFNSLIRTRYAEISKAENEQQIQILIDRFTTRFQDENKLNQAISTYKSVLQLTPELSENDTVAIFRLDNGFIKLSQMTNGKWGFHL